MFNAHFTSLMLRQLKDHLGFSLEQRTFITTLLEGKPGKSGWRSWAEIKKCPSAESKMSWIRVETQEALRKASFWDFRYVQTLKMLLTVHRLGFYYPEDEIKFIQNILRTVQPNRLQNIAKIQQAINKNLPLSSEIDRLVAAIDDELKNTNVSNTLYQRELRKVRSGINSVQETFVRHKAQFQGAEGQKNLLDALYSATQTRFHGTMMLPVCQAFDSRLGNSGGECFGYAVQWGKRLLENKPFGGISPEQAPLFKPIQFNSAAGKRYPDLNHLAPITHEITTYQKLQTNFSSLKDAFSFYAGDEDEISLRNFPTNILSLIFSNRYFISSKGLANRLIIKANENSTKVLCLTLMGYSGGHAASFCKKNGRYHFFDSNFGWIRFDDADNFKAWFAFYYTKIGYNRQFHEYHISTMELTTRTCTQSSQKDPADDLYKIKSEKKMSWGAFASSVLVFLLSFPLGCIVLGYHFLYRRGVYLGFSLLDRMLNLFSSSKEEQHCCETSSSHKGKIKRSIDDLDAFYAQKKARRQESFLTELPQRKSCLIDANTEKNSVREERQRRRESTGPYFFSDSSNATAGTQSSKNQLSSLDLAIYPSQAGNA